MLNQIHFQLGHEDRLALLGANGQGKSTLLKLLVGELESEDGEVRKSAKLRVGYFAQHQTEALDLNETPIQALGRVMPSGSTETQIRSRLGALDFPIIVPQPALGIYRAAKGQIAAGAHEL